MKLKYHAVITFGVISLLSVAQMISKSLVGTMAGFANFDSLSIDHPNQLVLGLSSTGNATTGRGILGPGNETSYKRNRTDHAITSVKRLTFSQDNETDFNRWEASSPHAYAFMIFRVDPGDGSAEKEKGAYKPYLADILIAAELFRRLGSTSDIVALISLVQGHDRLPREDARLLIDMGVKIRYFKPIIPDDVGGFVLSNLNKIEILKMTEYRRVLLLDCDAIPLVNLDYLFLLSETTMKPNMILATANVPMNGGFLMVEPTKEGFHQARELVQRRLEGKRFDRMIGWGSKVPAESPMYINRDKKGMTQWAFSAADGDQGFFYHYTRFMRQNVTQILAKRLIHYGPGPNGTNVIERIDNSSKGNNPFRNATKRPFNFVNPTCQKMRMCSAGPYNDVAHFMGLRNIAGKPWMASNPAQYLRSSGPPKHAMHLWWKTLFELEDRLGFNYTGGWLYTLSK